ncbi:MAG: deoxyribodipyrimidine photo-lyase [Acidobacteria bacterium]|nr:deoxyribodipyrimidine photo-lyase [Acidobacteriota bacterium]
MIQISERVQLLNDKPANNDGKYVLYWMQMFKRAEYNHALNFAVERANERRLPVVVYEGLKYYYPWASDRIHTFILEGVAEKRKAFEKLGIKYVFYLQKDERSPKDTVARIARDAALIVTDDFPCFIIPRHNAAIVRKAEIPVYAVDSNGVVPMSRFEKEEYAAYTIRPKIKKMLGDYLKPFEEVKPLVRAGENLKIDCPDTDVAENGIEKLVAGCAIDHTVKPSFVYRGGTANGRRRLKKFVAEILPDYDAARNRPERDGSSRLSAYLHFGYLSALEIALAVRDADAPAASKEAYLEELIVRRELSYNFTRFNPDYDSLKSLPPWVQETMRRHADDHRAPVYTLDELEAGRTYDELWNAAQREMVVTGEMHNYVRMLWGKNVIGWTRSYEEAFAILEHLNNKYCLDGRNPNSYAGILWCFGKHDRPWMERPVFGTIRYMTSASTGKKFDSKRYIEWTKTLAQGKLF